MSIHQAEVTACLKGSLPLPVETVAVDHYLLGGFHPHVQESDRAAFRAWLNTRPGRDLSTPPRGTQLDLLPLTTGAA